MVMSICFKHHFMRHRLKFLKIIVDTILNIIKIGTVVARWSP